MLFPASQQLCCHKCRRSVKSLARNCKNIQVIHNQFRLELFCDEISNRHDKQPGNHNNCKIKRFLEIEEIKCNKRNCCCDAYYAEYFYCILVDFFGKPKRKNQCKNCECSNCNVNARGNCIKRGIKGVCCPWKYLQVFKNPYC